MILRVGLFLMGLMVAFVLAIGLLFHFTGVLVVDVKDKVHGNRIYVPVPMLLVRGALWAIPERAQFHAPDELRKNRELILSAARALEECPDGNFVEIETRREKVQIKKEDGNLYVDVISPKEEVHLQVPIAEAGATLADLAIQ